MEEQHQEQQPESAEERQKKIAELLTYIQHPPTQSEIETPKYFAKKLILFVITFICTTFAGSEWIVLKNVIYSPDYSWADFVAGMSFSIPFLAILGVHEFGHYFTARFYKVVTTLPNFIPGWFGFLGFVPSIGTFGALIRIIGPIKSRKQYFDIGLAGPLAGFILAIGVLFYGFTHLPPPEHIFKIHPEYQQYGLNYADHVYNNPDQPEIYLGNNMIFWLFEHYVADQDRLPNHYEMFHYPLLFAGFLALFFTALNLIPIGQLDGGHILYGIFGQKRQRKISGVLYVLFAYVAGIGWVNPMAPASDMLINALLDLAFLFLCFQVLRLSRVNQIMLSVIVFTGHFLTKLVFPEMQSFEGYLLFVFIIGRFIGVYHPVAAEDKPLSKGRVILGWIMLIIFFMSFSPNPFLITGA